MDDAADLLACAQEAKKFDTIDRTFVKIMADTAKDTNVLAACSVDGRLQTLQALFESLESCQKSLSEYLDTKRCAFPRFYFISDVRAPLSSSLHILPAASGAWVK